MKTSKLVLLATFFAFAMVSFTTVNAGEKPKPGIIEYQKVINLTFEQAISNPALVTVMLQQLNENSFDITGKWSLEGGWAQHNIQWEDLSVCPVKPSSRGR